MSELPDRIVYVDDEQDMRNIVRQVVDDSGYEGAFAACGSGKELLDRLRILQPELILLDLVMDEMDGPDTLQQLNRHEFGKGAAVIFVTGAKNLSMIDQYKKLGVVGVIHKPFDLDSFLDQISAIWRKHLAVQGEGTEEGGEEE